MFHFVEDFGQCLFLFFFKTTKPVKTRSKGHQHHSHPSNVSALPQGVPKAGTAFKALARQEKYPPTCRKRKILLGHAASCSFIVLSSFQINCIYS